MATNRQLNGYTPEAASYVNPVVVGTVAGLHGCATPGGKGMLFWHDGSTAYAAVVGSPEQIAQASIITSLGQASTVIATGGTCYGITGFTDGTNLYAIVAWKEGTHTGYVRCYIANSPENPTSWSLQGTVNSGSHNSYGFDVPGWRTVGAVTILETGRWVFTGVYWSVGAIALQPAAGIYTTDNQGASWTNRVLRASNSNSPPAFNGRVCWDICRDPVTGTLYWHFKNEQSILYSSTDNGSSWGQSVVSDSNIRSFSVEDWSNNKLWATTTDDSDVFAAEATGVVSAPASYAVSSESLLDLSGLGGEYVREIQTNVIDGTLYVFCQNRVSAMEIAGWFVGGVY